MTLDFKRCRNVEQLQKVLNSLYRLYYTCVNIRRIPYFLKTLLYPISLPPSGLSRLHDRILGIWKEREKRFRVRVRTRSTIGEIEPERRRMKCRKTFSSSFFLSKSFAQSTKPISFPVNSLSFSLSPFSLSLSLSLFSLSRVTPTRKGFLIGNSLCHIFAPLYAFPATQLNTFSL